MTDSDRTYRIFISAAEPSGDKLCAKLITALKQTGYKTEITGFGGPNMAQAGCTLLINTTQKAAMTYNALNHILFFYKAVKKAQTHFAETKPDLVIVCDSPSFNFHIAKAAKAAGIKTLFYVAPQLWAWAAWRIEKLKRLCTGGLAAILPFEPDWFAGRGLECQFVGNPLLEEINAGKIAPKKYTNFSVSGAHIALIPGSRKSEIETLWPAMQHIARRLKARHPSLRFTAVAANEQVETALRQNEMKILRCNYAVDAVYDTAKNVDFALVASGSATLQVAAAACPMVIMYQSNKYLWHLVGKRIVKTKHLSLVNILAQKELVPEFMPYFPSVAPIVDICEKLLNAPEKLAETSVALAELAKPLAGINTSRNIAEMIIKQLHEPEDFTA
ncbi:MAG: lipid-A-disaccharide synthase [Planctomycetes bacterium HGW-Planctomycetes-1]|nr:MAG: lipid-A-disaccharide synthase [Planctomycetes bacterium HGW-Planctomycetes-1]